MPTGAVTARASILSSWNSPLSMAPFLTLATRYVRNFSMTWATAYSWPPLMMVVPRLSGSALTSLFM